MMFESLQNYSCSNLLKNLTNAIIMTNANATATATATAMAKSH